MEEKGMLKGIPPIISPELMKIMLEMGHGDDLVIADGNFPACSCARRLLRADGHGVPAVLEALLKFFPLDSFVKHPVALMAVPKGDPVPDIWKTYGRMLSAAQGSAVEFGLIERFEFYDRAKEAYAIVATGETALYANVIIKKGVVK